MSIWVNSMKAIVTIRLPRNPDHDPLHKKSGLCPVSNEYCTDITGEHHSILMEASVDFDTFMTVAEGIAKAHKGKVTRFEVVEK